MSDNELPGMWEEADFTGGQDEVRPSSADTHRDPYRGTGMRGKATSPEAEALEQVQLPADALLGEVTTRSLLEELRLRGDFLMTVMPTTERGQDGAVLSAIATAVLKSSTPETLETVRGK